MPVLGLGKYDPNLLEPTKMILHSRIIGEGQPLLILHGLFGQSDNWQTLGKVFAEHYQVHLIDQRNHGHSFHADEWNYDVMADDLFAYIQHHNLVSINIIGHSMGGKTVMHFAVSNPSLIEKLIVVDIAPKAYAPHHETILAGLEAIDFEKINSRKGADAAMAQHIPIPSVRQFLLKNLYWIEKEKLAWRFNLPVISANIKNVGEALPERAFADIPVLFAHGAKSDYIIDGDDDLILNHFPQAQIVEIPNAGHWIHAENPKGFHEACENFLES
ncbi:MAG: esterase [Candidatus Azotimanducaceae bacterium]